MSVTAYAKAIQVGDFVMLNGGWWEVIGIHDTDPSFTPGIKRFFLKCDGGRDVIQISRDKHDPVEVLPASHTQGLTCPPEPVY